jgi:hypothetical protein
MLLPMTCPICGKSSIEPVLHAVKVVATYERFQGDVGGLKVYRCKEEGHIFFVRASDLPGPSAETMAS